jgi:hypothetical protein
MPVLITWTVLAGPGATVGLPSFPIGIGCAKAAVAAATGASRPAMNVASSVVSRPGRATAFLVVLERSGW